MAVDVKDGTLTVTEGDGEAMSGRHVRGHLPEARRGEQKPERAVMTGKIRVKGNMGAASKLQKILAKRPRRHPKPRRDDG